MPRYPAAQRCRGQGSKIWNRFHRAEGESRSPHPACRLLSWEITFVTSELRGVGKAPVSSQLKASIAKTSTSLKRNLQPVGGLQAEGVTRLFIDGERRVAPLRATTKAAPPSHRPAPVTPSLVAAPKFADEMDDPTCRK
jgi:hypothetical protein